MDRRNLGAVRQRKAGQILSPDPTGTQTAYSRTIEVGEVLPRYAINRESSRAGGTMSPFFQKLRLLVHRHRKEDDLREELQFHLDEEAEERQAEGLTGEEARYAAHREIGNLTLVQEETRAAWTWTYLEQFAQDCRYGFRTMASNKTFSLLAILSLALGIGA